MTHMRTDNPAMQVDQPKVPEALKNSTMAQRKAAREEKSKTKQVKSAEDKAVKGSSSK
jgi:hypothetical protein